MSKLLKIRCAKAQDLPALLTLYTHLTGEPPYSIEHAEKVFQNFERYAGSRVFIGWLSERAVASCALVVVPNLTRAGTPYALIENVVTHAQFRKRGYGRAVLEAAIAAAWDAGCYKVMLLAGSKSPEILDFYSAAGFEQSKTGFQIRRIAARKG